MKLCWAHRIDAVLTPVECRRILANLPELTRSGVIGPGGAHQIDRARTCSDGWISSEPEWAWLHEKIRAGIDHANAARYRFDINYVEPLQVLRYRPGQFYLPHFDNNAKSVETRKLTLVVQLSESTAYLGGGLHVFGTPRKLYRTKTIGAGTIFPSYLMHTALPVILGTRYALVAWAHGPAWR